MTHGSLFSGIGGFDLAAEWMGWENIFHCEWNPFGQKVLNHYWPNAKSYHDIKKTDFTIHRGTIDILTGGFPCQPYSLAGKRKGEEDERHLWPEMLRAIREIQPRWVVGENVHGIINWSDGMVFEQVCTELENEGYQVTPYVLPASGIGAVHGRKRVWFVAYSDRNGLHRRNGKNEVNTNKTRINALNDAESFFASYTISRKREMGRNDAGVGWEWELDTRVPGIGQKAIKCTVCGMDDGVPGWMDKATFSKWRKESLKGFGNAIVPQLALQIFKSIEEYATELQK